MPDQACLVRPFGPNDICRLEDFHLNAPCGRDLHPTAERRSDEAPLPHGGPLAATALVQFNRQAEKRSGSPMASAPYDQLAVGCDDGPGQHLNIRFVDRPTPTGVVDTSKMAETSEKCHALTNCIGEPIAVMQ